MMKLEYVKVAHYEKDRNCPYTDAVVCDKKKCYKCGWNPKVAQARMEKIQTREVKSHG